jgi:restriction system protein
MSLIDKIANLFKPKPQITEEEFQRRLKEIARISAEKREQKVLELDRRRTELHLKPKIEIPAPKPKPVNWNLELLMSLEWKRFEEVCKEYLIIKDYDARLTDSGADGGVDIKLYRGQQLIGLVQCKAWINKVSVKEIRELYGVMASAEITQGIFFTTSSFTEDAIAFKKNKNITLIDGRDFIKRIKTLKLEEQEQLYKFATVGDYTTPTCANCDAKMVKRTTKDSGNDFWGCANYPRCRNTLQMRRV